MSEDHDKKRIRAPQGAHVPGSADLAPGWRGESPPAALDSRAVPLQPIPGTGEPIPPLAGEGVEQIPRHRSSGSRAGDVPDLTLRAVAILQALRKAKTKTSDYEIRLAAVQGAVEEVVAASSSGISLECMREKAQKLLRQDPLEDRDVRPPR